MHGRHHTSLVTIACASPIGRVARSLVGPNTAVTGTPAAAARGKIARKVGEVFGRPSLRSAVRRAGRDRGERRAPIPPPFDQQARARAANGVSNRETRLDVAVRKTERVYQLLVVLDLMQP